jgi:tetratricopeptide (TPR) repeat protein
LLQPGAVAISAVSGMGGVGKTELATQYARQHEADYPGGICWLNARTSNLAAEIVQFALQKMNLEVPQQNFRGRQLSLIEQVHWCWQHWQPPERLALVVLDDITDLGSCREFLPTAHRFRVLMTTRLPNLDTNIEEISLDVLSEEEALQLLTKLVGERRVQKEEQTAKLLCEWLGYLPLGLELVGRYLAEDPDLSLTQMLERLKARRLKDEALEHQQLTLSVAQLGVLAAFELSWLELGSMTQLVGKLLSLFAPNIIPWRLVESVGDKLNWAKADINEAKKQLYKRHLIQQVEEKEACYKIHPLIREFLQAKLAALAQQKRPKEFFGIIWKFLQVNELFKPRTPENIKRAFAETFIAIAQTIPQSPTQEIIKSVKDAIPHLAEVAQNLIYAVSDEKLILIFVGLDRFYSGQGLYTLAQLLLEQSILVIQSRLGDEHPDVATSFNNLAAVYKSLGQYTQAEPLFIKALEIASLSLGVNHPNTITIRKSLKYLRDNRQSYNSEQ